ncbi:DEAD/DEAH box helicase [Oceanisphaera avium]|uniref:DEAD/DEAH box helicase n=1 Tax=Oceanisphaera avium TaxID=1903694 RepID=A0A1Y0CWQ7_9GAMM|nr:DEAD/DEAH box helicase [Oceanisphaera avium]ART79326.1 DEAD/DEAH box helicase [Oceanisphaera avium]
MPNLLAANVATDFLSLGLEPRLVAALPSACEVPTAVQQHTLPLIIQGQEVVALAPTGSGKTLAFGLGVLQQLVNQSLTSSLSPTSTAVKPSAITAVILVPTRELATQISAVLLPLAQSVSLSVATLCGGTEITEQAAALKRQPAQIVIATPGRLLDLLRQKLLSLKDVQHLVLDEADRLLDMGFWPDVHTLMQALPALQQTLLFSATLSQNLETKLQEIIPNAHRFSQRRQNTVVANITQRCYLVNKGSKAQALIALLKNELSALQVLVFINARDSADALSKRLNKAGIKAAALHGEKNQSERDQTLQAFRDDEIKVLVATDLLARGIDVPALPVVVNLDLPPSAPVYVHRVGRTARAGLSGLALSLVCHGEASALAAIRELTGEALPLLALEGFTVTDQAASTTPNKRAPRDKKANRRTMKPRR